MEDGAECAFRKEPMHVTSIGSEAGRICAELPLEAWTRIGGAV
jgi:hypothetical protein